MSLSLLKATFKANYKLWLIMFFVMLMYSSIIVSMYDPNNMAAWESMLELFPEEILKAMNFNIVSPTFLGYIAGYYYGFIMIMFPMIFVIISGNRMIAKYVDNGSMSFLLATPNTRQKIAITQAVYMLLSTILLIFITALLILLFGTLMFPGNLEIGKFMLLNLNIIGLFVILSGITFFASCLFNESRQAIGVGAGVLIVFFVINMLAGVNDQLDFLKYFTVFTLFDTEKIIQLNVIIYVHMMILYSIGLSFYFAGVKIFNVKNLHI